MNWNEIKIGGRYEIVSRTRTTEGKVDVRFVGIQVQSKNAVETGGGKQRLVKGRPFSNDGHYFLGNEQIELLQEYIKGLWIPTQEERDRNQQRQEERKTLKVEFEDLISKVSQQLNECEIKHEALTHEIRIGVTIPYNDNDNIMEGIKKLEKLQLILSEHT